MLSEKNYRKKKKYQMLIENRDELRESFIYRLGIMKKFIQNQLYLDDKYVKEKNYIMHVVAMFAAGAAALVAYSVEFYRQVINPTVSLNAGIFLIISSIVYMLKDRIKDILKVILSKKIINRYDLEREIQMPGSRNILARSQEIITLLKDRLDDDIVQIRENTSSDGVVVPKQEDVIHYSKKFNVDWGQFVKFSSPLASDIKEIYRFDFSDFMLSMDDTKQKFLCFSEKCDSIEEIKLDKTYHINIILRFASNADNRNKQSLEKSYYRLRVIADKKGIRRIENVSIL